MLRKMKNWLVRKEDGIGTVETVLLLVVIIALVIIFRDQITALLETIFTKINDSVNSL